MERLNGGNEYDLGRDFVASVRLDLQHYLWKETLRYDLHPRAGADSSSVGLRIADVGTGTGIFILSLARRLPPSCSFVGFDISDAQFPISESIPKNVSFRVANAMTEPPHDLQSQFDIVHLRLFVCVVENNDPLPALNFCLKLLKPGGFLQWDEYDQTNNMILKMSPHAPTEAIAAMTQGFKTGRQLTWVPSLRDICASHGLQNLDCIRTRPPPELLKLFTQTSLVLYLEHASLHDASGNKQKADSLRKLVAECAAELQQGGVRCHMLQVVIGQKPPSQPLL